MKRSLVALFLLVLCGFMPAALSAIEISIKEYDFPHRIPVPTILRLRLTDRSGILASRQTSWDVSTRRRVR